MIPDANASTRTTAVASNEQIANIIVKLDSTHIRSNDLKTDLGTCES